VFVEITVASVFVIFYVSTTESMGVRGSDGNVTDLYSYGIMAVIIAVTLHHV
jgi:hypothetical protein